MKAIKHLTLIAILLGFNACLIQKRDPYAHLTKFSLCNKSKTTKEATCPYVNDEKLRISTKRHFSGDSLMIEMRVVQQEPNEETSSSNIEATKLQPGECMDYYLELTDTEQLRMDNIEALYIVVDFEEIKQVFKRIGEKELVVNEL